MIYVGVDPGNSGAIVRINEDHGLEWFRFSDTESFSTSCVLLREFIERIPPDSTIYVEKVHSMPGQGVVSVFSFGNALGHICGMLKQEGLRYKTVQPQEWQAKLGLTNATGKETFKNAAAKKSARKKIYQEFAKKLFPKYKNNISLDLADAVLIAEYAYRQSMKEEYDV
jgi:crossover junction endodeoxyribonuclease RuvC